MIVAILLMAGLVWLYPNPAQAQIDTYPFVAYGAFSDDAGRFERATWIGAQVPLGGSVVNRTGWFYCDLADQEIEGFSSWILASKSLKRWGTTGISLTMGGGILYEVNDGDNTEMSGFKTEVAFAVAGCSFALGADYQPVRSGHDQWFLYGGFGFGAGL
jgi:hypothetical protein